MRIVTGERGLLRGGAVLPCSITSNQARTSLQHRLGQVPDPGGEPGLDDERAVVVGETVLGEELEQVPAGQADGGQQGGVAGPDRAAGGVLQAEQDVQRLPALSFSEEWLQPCRLACMVSSCWQPAANASSAGGGNPCSRPARRSRVMLNRTSWRWPTSPALGGRVRGVPRAAAVTLFLVSVLAK